MPNGEDEPSRPQVLTPANVWDRIDHLATETREARHSQNNLFQRALGEHSASIRKDFGTVDDRLRTIETTLAASSVASLGLRLTELERAVDRSGGDTSLSGRLTALDGRIDRMESRWDGLDGSIRLIKGVQIALAIAAGVIAVLTWAGLQ